MRVRLAIGLWVAVLAYSVVAYFVGEILLIIPITLLAAVAAALTLSRGGDG